MTMLQSENEELEQYGRRLCIRVEGFPTTDNETWEEVLKKVQSLINEAECAIPDEAIDRAHRIGNGYKDRKTNALCKSIIVRFAPFRHRQLFYRNRNKLKSNAQIQKSQIRFDKEKVYSIYESFRVSQEGQYCGLRHGSHKLSFESSFQKGPK